MSYLKYQFGYDAFFINIHCKTAASLMSLRLLVTEYYKIKKELKYEGSDIKLFRKNVKDEMLKRRLEFERI